MSDRSNKSPTFFTPRKIDRKLEVYHNGVKNDDSPNGIGKDICRRYHERLTMWKDHSKQLFQMEGKNTPPEMRILITGSRKWDDVSIIRNSLLWYSQFIHGYTGMDKRFQGYRLEDIVPTLVSGACPEGADLIAETLAQEWGWNIKTFPADWKKFGDAAGGMRNSDMVRDGDVDICLGFLLNASRGTWDCIKKAQNYNIFTVTHDLQDSISGWS